MPGSYKPLITEMAQPMGPAPGRHGQVVLQGQSATRTDGPAQSHWSWADRLHNVQTRTPPPGPSVHKTQSRRPS